MPLCETALTYILSGQPASDPKTKEEAEVRVKQAAHFSPMKGFRNTQHSADSVKWLGNIKEAVFYGNPLKVTNFRSHSTGNLAKTESE